MRQQQHNTQQPAQPYRVGQSYPVTEVLGYWLMLNKSSWVPIMGELHEDGDLFGVHEYHYHVDPRFLSEDSERCSHQVGMNRFNHHTQLWHPAYRQVLTHFNSQRGECFTITTDGTTIKTLRNRKVRKPEPRQWGLDRIQRRRRIVRCERELPPAHLTMSSEDRGFRTLRQLYQSPCTNTCPHRGYDLRSVPIDANGFRQCPLHQLLVRAC